jgi:hypothetical protein
MVLAPLASHAQFGGGSIGDTAYRRITPEDATKLLQDFRRYRLPDDFCFEFVITHKPRRGDDETKYNGTLWGTWNEKGPLIRVELKKSDEPLSSTRRFILQSGPAPDLWGIGTDGKPTRSADDTLKPLFDGLIFTPFELQTPFTYWDKYQYVGTKGFKNRATHIFDMTPPDSFKARHPEFGYVRLSFDREYNALMQAVIYDSAKKPQRQLEAVSFNKVQGQYIPGEVSLRDETNRDKDTMSITAAVLKINLPKSVFDPATLAHPAPKPQAESFTKLD